MKVKILGSGCKKCIALSDKVVAAAKATGIEVQLEKITDIVAIAGYGVMSTPGLVIDEKVVSTGKIPTEDELQKILIAQK